MQAKRPKPNTRLHIWFGYFVCVNIFMKYSIFAVFLDWFFQSFCHCYTLYQKPIYENSWPNRFSTQCWSPVLYIFPFDVVFHFTFIMHEITPRCAFFQGFLTIHQTKVTRSNVWISCNTENSCGKKVFCFFYEKKISRKSVQKYTQTKKLKWSLWEMLEQQNVQNLNQLKPTFLFHSVVFLVSFSICSSKKQPTPMMMMISSSNHTYTKHTNIPL